MIRYALYDYIPQRMIRYTSFEERDICRKILSFKDGRNIYTRWAARCFAKLLSGNNMSCATIVCVPASTTYANIRRWKHFSKMLCQMTGATDGFEHVRVYGNRKRAHVTGEYELASNIKHYVHIDADFFCGRQVIIVDDIVTTGQSSRAFAEAIESTGATVVMSVFLAKTRSPRR